jgi:rare lipoprotein A
MFKTTDRLTRTAASADVGLTKEQSPNRTFLQALRLTVAAVLFVVGTFLSFGADTAEAKTTKGKKAVATKKVAKASPKSLKASKTKAATKAKTKKAIASKAQTLKSKATAAKSKKATYAKANAKATKKSSKAKQFTDKIKRGASKATAMVRNTAKKAAQKFSGNFALLNRYKQDLAVYGAQKLESWSKKMTGEASWYGTFFHGRLTASGRRFNKHADIAAHRSLPFGTILKVTNKDNGKTAIVEVLDRGPYVGDRLIDLSEGSATKLGYMGTGTANVETEILKVGDMKYEVEAPLTAAEMRGDVIKHRIDLAGLNVNSSESTYANSMFLGSSSFGATLPEMKTEMDALASTSVVDSSQLYALLNQPAYTGRA